MVEALTDKHDIPRAFCGYTFPQPRDTFRLQLLLQDVFEILFAQQVQPVPRDAGEQHMKHPRRKHTVAGI